jgi:glycosyltransferase 2 family protein
MSVSLTPPPVVRRAWLWLRLVGGCVVLAVLLWHFGTGPFAEAWRVTTWPVVAVALVVTVLTTLSCAWRWRVVSDAFGVPLTTRTSVAAYYRSQFLNGTLPGGILGDAHRAVRHGRDVGDVAAGVRATVWDRVSGQVVQVGLTLLALLVLPSPLRVLAPLAIGAIALLALVGVIVHERSPLPGSSRVGADVRALLRLGTATRVAVASIGTTLGHLVVLLVAARAAGVHASWSVLVTTGLVVLVLSSVPLNIAGWGPREGAAAWAFAWVGLGSSAGLTVAVVYGVVATVSSLPGALVLVADAATRRTRRPMETPEATATDRLEVSGHG